MRGRVDIAKKIKVLCTLLKLYLNSYILREVCFGTLTAHAYSFDLFTEALAKYINIRMYVSQTMRITFLESLKP